MNCDELEDLYGLYALGLLEAPELAEAREHLGRGCPRCQQSLRQAMEMNVMMLGSLSPIMEPPAALRGRILASVGARPAGRFGMAWLPWAAVAATLVMAAWLGNDRTQLRSAITRLEAQASEERQRLGFLQAMVDLVAAPATRQVQLGPAAPAQGRVYVNAERGVLLMAANLPELQQGRTFEMWLVPRQGAPVPAGLFGRGPGGTGLHLRPGPVEVALVAAIAVSVEPTGGSPAPTTTPFLIAPLGP